MSANLYDLLDVEETASTEEIRAAWKSAIADLDPTERRFRAYSDAAGVLLDADKRAAYDAELAAAREAEESAAAAAAEEAEPSAEPEEPVAEDTAAEDVTTADASPDDTDTETDTETDTDDAAVPDPTGPTIPVLVAVGIAALLSAVLAVWVLTLPGARADEPPKDVAERSTRQERAAISAEGAAEKMVAPVLSYNHQTMPADLERLTGHLTDRMADKQKAAWSELTKEAQAQKVVVEAKAAGTALTRVDPAGRRATVVAFIDQYVEKADSQPFVLRMWATMSLVRESDDGRWLLDDLCTDDSCG
ncbi:hypothetical protein KG112_03710 [Nocardioides sp. zg-ZUI104]|uniref:hypothetical protein n=1 Tax=Nocardioides faecalis TaxID=2803858 RepID=UPI001BD0E274|nr:hypothetical protein [Nocardioides faecalis]MBS4751914.1 hypothetical protein [Nocardioides faecalis]